MAMSRIILRLARNPGTEFIDGDPERGYALIAPLTSEGKLDVDVYAAAKAACTVRRFAPGEDAAEGKLRRRGQIWFFDYQVEETTDDEPVFKLGHHRFLSGDYVTVTDEKGRALTYQVSEVVRLCED